MYSLNQRFDNQEIPEEEYMTSGNLACAGCGASLSMRLALKGLGKPTVLVVPACCCTIIPGAWPQTAMEVPFFNTAFETTGATISGLKAAYRKRGMDDVCVVGWAGDGGTFDIGIQALSGAAERSLFERLLARLRRFAAVVQGIIEVDLPAGIFLLVYLDLLIQPSAILVGDEEGIGDGAVVQRTRIAAQTDSIHVQRDE